MICPITVLKEDRSEPACDMIILSGQGEWQSLQSVSTSGCKKFQTMCFKMNCSISDLQMKKKKEAELYCAFSWAGVKRGEFQVVDPQ